MGLVAGCLVGGIVCQAAKKKLCDVGWVSSDWFEAQLRQVEDQLSQAENRILCIEAWRRG